MILNFKILTLIHPFSRWIFFILLSLSFAFSPLSAGRMPSLLEHSFKVNMQNYIQEIRKLEWENKLDGKLLIAKKDRIVFSAQSREMARMPHEPQFMIGSLSKQFFAVALLKLLYDKYPDAKESERMEFVKEQLSRPLSDFLPPSASIWNGDMPQWAHSITLHQLLTHTSGLPNYTEVENYTEIIAPGKRFFEIPHSKREIIGLISHLPLRFQPGTQFDYCNTGYVLIAEVIETLSGLPASAYLQQALFIPLHLNSTFSPPSGQWPALKKWPHLSRLMPQWQYDRKKEINGLYQPEGMIDMSNAIGSGSIISTARDLLKWNLALHKESTIIPPALYQLMTTPEQQGYGYGIGVASSSHGVLLGHQGFIDTHRSALFYFPEHELSIIFLSHIRDDDDRLADEQEEIMASYREDDMSEEEKKLIAMEELMEKYPDERGFNQFLHLTNTHFEVQDME
jgi:CubicO group peptidase (beta-lactamase class C family)